MANMKAMIDVDWERGKALREAYPEIITDRSDPDRQEAVVKTAEKADDWQFYRHYSGTVNAGYVEIKFALSPALGVSRPLLLGEFYKLNSCSPEHYEKYHGPIPDPLAPEQLAKRHEKQEPQERRFHIQVSYSTVGSSPEDALETFFAAVRQPGSMVAEIHEEGADRVVEIDGDTIVEIAARAYGEPAEDGPSGP